MVEPGAARPATGAPSYASLHVGADAVAGALRFRRSCVLPRAAAADPARGTLFVACQGIDAVLELDARAHDPMRAEKRRWLVAAGPTGVALDGARGEALVWSQHDRAVGLLALEPGDAPALAKGARRAILLPLGRGELDDEGPEATGRRLFHRSGDPRIAADGRACASCHPDGRDDGLTWPTPEGPRQPPMLAGRLDGTAPYSWAGNHASLKDHVTTTFTRLGGKGLPGPALDALLAYMTALEGPVRTSSGGGGGEPGERERGRAVFASVETGCTSCHREERGYADGSLHDVGSSAAADRFSTFDTPSLRFVGGTAPYFHDGRYATLREMLLANDGKMGNTRHLGEEDLRALEGYLESL